MPSFQSGLPLNRTIILKLNMEKQRVLTAIAAIFGLCSVALGAFGAHALDARLEALETREVWKTAVDYQMWHALALLFLAISPLRGRAASLASDCFCIGIPLFSGSLYWLALDGPRWLGPITPLGGLSMIIGWVMLMIAALQTKNE